MYNYLARTNLLETLYLVLMIIFAVLLFMLEVVKPIVVGFIVGKILYKKHLVRATPEDWGRNRCSDPTNYEQMIMWQEGLAWGEENKSFCEPVDITSAGFHLFGEYYDFGNKKAVIIVPGRTETLQYSYYFAIPYKELGFNILVIDKRAHGLSEGKYEDGGQFSHVDLLEWAKFLHEKYGLNDLTLHGICIGGSTCTFAYASKDKPAYLKRMVVDGLFITFYETFKNHLIDARRPVFPYCRATMHYAKKYTKADLTHNGPIYQIDKIKDPVLFLYSKVDIFSTPEQAHMLYEKCGANKKELVFFDKGCHSHILINNPEKYRESIKKFVEETSN